MASTRRFRSVRIVLSLVALAGWMAGCSGGAASLGGPAGGSSAGVAAVGVSVASSASFPAGTTFSATTSAASVTSAAKPAADQFDNVLVWVTRVALIPAAGTEFPDRDGQLEAVNARSEEGAGGQSGFVTVTLPRPVVIDLLHPPTARQVARLFNKFGDVPAGSYSKIRVYYEKVVGVRNGERTQFHATAHYHFDVHFVGGNLVVPVATNPDGGIRFYAIAIHVVGLKIHEAGNSEKYLMRPQVFATVEAPKYLVSGVARDVEHALGTFDVVTADNTVVPAAWDARTGWLFVDGRAVDPGAAGALALEDGAIVDVIGAFRAGLLEADEVDIAFPDLLDGYVHSGWRPDNTFVLRLPYDNVVFPQPDRAGAFYDNALAPYLPLTDAAVDNNAFVTARGYRAAGGIRAFWISIGL